MTRVLVSLVQIIAIVVIGAYLIDLIGAWE